MTEDDVSEQTKDAYLCLIHPYSAADFQQRVALVIALAPSVPDELITTMISGRYWREGLLGLCLAMAKHPVKFIEPVLQSLRKPTGITIVPACAMLAVLARRGIYSMPDSFAQMFDRTARDGEIGWATDKAMFFAGLCTDDVTGRGPNYGQNFDDHTRFYDSIPVA